MALDRSTYNPHLSSQNRIANSSPASYRFRRTESAKYSQQTGSGRGVADAHLTDSQKVHPVDLCLLPLFAANLDRLLAFLPRHRRFVQKVSSATPDRPDTK